MFLLLTWWNDSDDVQLLYPHNSQELFPYISSKLVLAFLFQLFELILWCNSRWQLWQSKSHLSISFFIFDHLWSLIADNLYFLSILWWNVNLNIWLSPHFIQFNIPLQTQFYNDDPEFDDLTDSSYSSLGGIANYIYKNQKTSWNILNDLMKWQNQKSTHRYMIL